jgi:hypothetical protein
MTISNTLAVIGALLIALAFLILGAELLKPEGLVPEEDRMSEVLGKLLGNVWGPLGFWFMIGAVFVSFWTTALTNQDGWARMFASGTRILLRQFGIEGSWTDQRRLRQGFLFVLLMVAPAAVYLAFGKPISLLMLAGGIEAAHIPIVAGLVLWMNRRALPRELGASAFAFWTTALAGLFFAAFAVFYILQISGIITA